MDDHQPPHNEGSQPAPRAERDTGADADLLAFPAYADELVRDINRLQVQRTPVSARLEGLDLSFSVALVDGQSVVDDPAIRCDVLIGGERCLLVIPRRVAERVASSIDPAPPGDLDNGTLLLLLNLALDPLLERVEVTFACPITPLELALPGHREGPHRLVVRGSLDKQPFLAEMIVGPRALHQIALMVERLPVRRTPILDLTTTCSLRVGATRLTRRQLGDLRVGDAVLLDENLIDRGLIAVAFQGLATLARIQDGGLALLTAPRSHGMFKDSLTMDSTSIPSAAAAPESELGALQITLVFEVGRQMIALSELETLKTGTVFSTGVDGYGTVQILANGTPVGAGQLVRIGSRLGVKTTRLFGHE